MLFVFDFCHLSHDPMFLIINAIIFVGLVTAVVATAIDERSTETSG